MPSLLDTYVAANYNQPKTVNGLGPKTTIVEVAKTNITTAELHQIITSITQGIGTGQSITNDAFTVAGVGTADGSAFVSGTTDVVFLVLQGTGVYTPDTNAHGVTGATTSIVATFVNPF